MGFNRKGKNASNGEAKWETVGKPKIVGTAVVTLKRHAEKGFGLAINDGEGHGWLSLGEELDETAVHDGIRERIERAKKELARCEELAYLAEDLAALVLTAKEAQPKAQPKVDPEACLQAARQFHAVKGVLPAANDPKVMQTAAAMAQAAQASIVVEQTAK